MYFEKLVAWRYLRSPRKNRSISIITFISTLGVALGVMTLIVALSVMNGFERDLRYALIGANAHVTVSHFGTPEVRGLHFDETAENNILQLLPQAHISPYTLNQALLMGKNRARGVLIKGLALEQEIKQETIARFLYHSDGTKISSFSETMRDLAPKNITTKSVSGKERQEKIAGIILGRLLARSLGVKVGDLIRMISSDSRISPIGPLARAKKFRVIAYYSSGISGYDEVLGFADAGEMQKLFRLEDKFSGIAVYIPNPEEAEEAKEQLTSIYPFPHYLTTWMEDNENLFSVIALEKTALAVILTLIILVAAFNIISSLIMLVHEKKKDVVILKSMGAKDRSIRNIFIYQGTLIGLLGTLLGQTAGILICYVIKNYEIIDIPTNVYVNNRIPMEMNFGQLLLIAGVSFTICFLVTIFPSTLAAKINPSEGLRHE